ncbi:MAG TPA: VOC family protein [Acidimicrobiales bacterium]|nr:VOC family protein [Acidimicrobiales bacterium]
MITAVHALVYADDPEAARAFFRDVLGWPHVDAHGGWLIFRTGPSELGVHPTSGERDGRVLSTPEHHEISLMCDDIDGTVAELAGRGAEFAGPVQEAGFGRTVSMKVPGAGEMLLYEPRHPVAHVL